MIIPPKTLGWAFVALIGLVVFIIQLLIPDLVPDAINGILSDNTSVQFVGIKPMLYLVLLVYYIFGFALFITGTFLSLLHYKRGE